MFESGEFEVIIDSRYKKIELFHTIKVGETALFFDNKGQIWRLYCSLFLLLLILIAVQIIPPIVANTQATVPETLSGASLLDTAIAPIMPKTIRR